MLYAHFLLQAMAVWNKDVCKLREAMDLSQHTNAEMFCRRGLADGDVPPAYVAKYSTPDAHLQLLRTLDFHFDNLKRLSRFDLKALNPVAVVINLLPEGWDAKVCRVVDDEHGLIVITHSQGQEVIERDSVRSFFIFV